MLKFYLIFVTTTRIQRDTMIIIRIFFIQYLYNYFNIVWYFRAELQNDVRILAGLEDQNIARVLGVCTSEQPLCVVMEYSEHGDLNQFLKTHVPVEAARNLPPTVKTLRYLSVSKHNSIITSTTFILSIDFGIFEETLRDFDFFK